MAIPKLSRRAAQLIAGTAAGAAAFVGGRAAVKKKTLPTSESVNQAANIDAPVAQEAEKKRRIPRITLPFSKKGGIAVRDGYTEIGEAVRILEVGGAYQSVTYTEPEKRFDLVLEYYRAFDLLFDFGCPVDSILALGAGGCSFPKHAAFSHPDVRVDAIEANEQIVKMAHEQFFIDDLPEVCHFELHHSDALDYLLKCQEDGLRYSAIINDCFDGKVADDGLLSPESLQLSKKCLQDNGLYLINVVSMRKGKNLRNVKKATRALNQQFKHVYVFPCTDAEMGGEDNYVIIATDGSYKIER